MKKVSVIMPCYNDGKYIKEAIASVEAQTYPEWELIIIDDGSDDKETIAIIDSIQNKKLRYIIQSIFARQEQEIMELSMRMENTYYRLIQMIK